MSVTESSRPKKGVAGRDASGVGLREGAARAVLACGSRWGAGGVLAFEPRREVGEGVISPVFDTRVETGGEAPPSELREALTRITLESRLSFTEMLVGVGSIDGER